jgi:hypothetical protein
MPLPYFVAGGIGLGISQRKRNKRTQAASNKFSQKYPLLEDCQSMEASIKNAKDELKSISAAPAKNRKSRLFKSADEMALMSWLNTMRMHLKDLKCGLNMSSSSNAVIPAQQTVQAAPIQAEIKEQPAPSESQNLASVTKKKGVNWLLIGGVAVAGIVVFKMLKKK